MKSLSLCSPWRRLIATSSFLLLTASSFAGSNPVVATGPGKLEGLLLSNGTGAAFRGVPFAQPPVGPLRWREPQPVKPWSGVRDASQPKPACAQTPTGFNNAFASNSQEDCLYLDVWTPQWPPKSAKPVMVWLHGGANTGGAGGSDSLYENSSLVDHGVVLVNVDYRLGVFGFFAHPELSRESPRHVSGNYGFLDQIAALQWVHDNIAKFGGDPSNVTIFGQSAGSMDLSALLTSPLAKGLIHRAIGESGAASRSAQLADAERAGEQVARALKAPAEGALAYLRSLSTGDLLRGGRGTSSPIIDAYVFESEPASVYAAGKALPVPMIIGSNAIEMGGDGTVEALRNNIQLRYRDVAPKALVLYGLTQPEDKGSVDPLYGTPGEQWAADTIFRCPGILQGEAHAAVGFPVWEYQFDRAIPPMPKVRHSSELVYVFGKFSPTGNLRGEFEEADRKLSAVIQLYWTNFAKTGDPNGPGAPSWPKYSSSSRKFVEFTRTGEIVTGENQRRAFCEAFQEAEKTARKDR